MKICPNCRNAVEDSAIFCDKCGTRFAIHNNEQSNYTQQTNNQSNYAQQTYNYNVNQPQFQPTTSQTQTKKKKTGMIIGIVAAVLIILAFIGSTAEKAFQNQGYGQSDENDYTPSYNYGGNNNDSSDNNDNDTTTNNEDSDVNIYTKGTVVDGWYINEWANMKFDANNNWANGSADEYASYAGDPNTECGVILNDTTNGKQLVICFEKLDNANVSITEDEYLDIITDGLNDQYTNANITCEISTHYNSTIANETFRSVNISFDSATMIQEFHIRKYDNYIIAVAIIAQNSFDASSVANNIRAIN